MPKFVTVRKQPWSNKYKADVLRGAVLNPNAAIESRYYLSLASLINQMTREVETEIKKLFESEHAEAFFAEDKSITAQAKILTNALTKKFEGLFSVNAKPLAERMVTQADETSAASVGVSLKQLSGGLTLSPAKLSSKVIETLSATVAENVSLIKSIPAQYLDGVQSAVMRSITTGNGLQDLVPYLNKHKGITLRRARMIASDQNRKAFNNLNKIRMQQTGIEKYEWLHTGGSDHPRKLHQKMSGNIYRFDDPPVIDEKTGERGIPGQLVNCRCRMVPVIEFDK